MFQWQKKVGEKEECVDVVSAASEKEIKMKITASQTTMARNGITPPDKTIGHMGKLIVFATETVVFPNHLIM